jgi:hypothetical protein
VKIIENINPFPQWRDTVVIPPYGMVRIWIRFDAPLLVDLNGKSVFHCHMLAHGEYPFHTSHVGMWMYVCYFPLFLCFAVLSIFSYFHAPHLFTEDTGMITAIRFIDPKFKEGQDFLQGLLMGSNL